MMAYMNTTKNRVVEFLKENKVCSQNELMYLRHKKKQIHQFQLREILEDLEADEHIRISVIEGKRVKKQIEWLK
jgi:hypothetical protein